MSLENKKPKHYSQSYLNNISLLSMEKPTKINRTESDNKSFNHTRRDTLSISMMRQNGP